MSYEFSYGIEEEFVAGFMIVYLIVWLLAMAFGIASYVLRSLGVYTIAKRRELNHPWMAWVPLLNLWTLGSISDQYRYVTKGKTTNKRKWLIGMPIAYVVFISIGIIVATVATELSYGSVDEETMFGAMLLCTLGILVLAIVVSVIRYFALYDLYRSCDPGNATLFLVLGILLPVTEPFFIFACRKKDEGMPPRRPRPTGYIPEQYGYQPQAPVYPSQPMGYQPPEAPSFKAPEYRPPVDQPAEPVYRPEPAEDAQSGSYMEPEAPAAEPESAPAADPWDVQ